MKKVTVSDKCQVALPVSVVRQTRIRPGDQLLVSLEGGRIVLAKPSRRRRSSQSAFWSMMKSWWREVAKRGGPDREARLLKERRLEAGRENRGL